VKLLASLAKNIQQVERNKETSRHATNAIMCATPPHTQRITERERERARALQNKTKRTEMQLGQKDRGRSRSAQADKDGPRLPSSLFFFSASFSASSSVPRELSQSNKAGSHVKASQIFFFFFFDCLIDDFQSLFAVFPRSPMLN
jgi:hypothetical protein